MRRVPVRATLAERLSFYSERSENGCLEWTGSDDGKAGYGKLRWQGRMRYAHQLAWEDANGPVPEGKVLRHRCDNPPCIDVGHLLVGTQAENVADSFARGRAANRTGEHNNSARLTGHPGGRDPTASRHRLDGAPARCALRDERIADQQRHQPPPMEGTGMNTLAELINTTGVDVHDYLDRDALVPIGAGLQVQGDLAVIPTRPGKTSAKPIPAQGIPVIRGEAGGNTHLLLASGPVLWNPAKGSGTTLGLIVVPEGSTAYLAHPEHGYLGIGTGSYIVRRQREQADIIRVVAD